MYGSMPNRLDPAFTLENYTKRMLQISIETQGSLKQDELNQRVAGDPTILSDCFAQHIAFYRQEFYFEIFGPFKKYQLPPSLQAKLESRMVLLGYNIKSADAAIATSADSNKSRRWRSSIEPFFVWLESTAAQLHR
jgi:hypothetical protein